MPAILFSLQYWVYGIPSCQLLRLQDSAMLVVLSNLHKVCKASTVYNSSYILSACLRADSYAGSMLLLCCFLQPLAGQSLARPQHRLSSVRHVLLPSGADTMTILTAHAC